MRDTKAIINVLFFLHMGFPQWYIYDFSRTLLSITEG
jgi:hypothetical protein